ncbi:hypothetical protein [Streptomyces sp. NPDC050564]|uniref:hypothetical protein n=1 Tax=Streptomyces sp. NPDC050564 TaxID=3365631 RepID=UPI003794CBB6
MAIAPAAMPWAVLAVFAACVRCGLLRAGFDAPLWLFDTAVPLVRTAVIGAGR